MCCFYNVHRVGLVVICTVPSPSRVWHTSYNMLIVTMQAVFSCTCSCVFCLDDHWLPRYNELDFGRTLLYACNGVASYGTVPVAA